MRDRDAGERAGRDRGSAGGQPTVAASSARLAVYRQEGIEAAVAPVDAGEQSFDQFDAGQALGGERLRELGERRVIIGSEIRIRGLPRRRRTEAGGSRRDACLGAVSGPAFSLDDLGTRYRPSSTAGALC